MGVIDKAVDWAVKIARDDSHGYDQASRFGPDYDCSSLTITAFKQAGVPLTCTYTGNMRSDMLAHGFKDVTASVNLKTGAGLQKGDVLLHEVKHTALYIGNGQIVNAGGNEFGKATGGKTGDQTGREIGIIGYYNFPWEYVLRYVAENINVPGKEDEPYEDAVENEDFYIVKQYDTLWGIAERFLGNGGLYPLIQQLNGMGQSTYVYPGMMLLLHPEGQEPEPGSGSSETTEPEPPEEHIGGAGAYQIALQVIRRGDSGAFVKQIQRLIIATGYKMPKYGADGDFGVETETAVKKFQKAVGVEVNGAVDKQTMVKLLGL